MTIKFVKDPSASGRIKFTRSQMYQRTRVHESISPLESSIRTFPNADALIAYIENSKQPKSDSQPYDPIHYVDYPPGYNGFLECLHFNNLGYILCGGNESDPEIAAQVHRMHFASPGEARSVLEAAGYKPYIANLPVFPIGDYGKAYRNDGKYRYQANITNISGECSWKITYNESPEPDFNLGNCAQFHGRCLLVAIWHMLI